MNPDTTSLVLAAVPEIGGYVNLYKIGVVVVLLIAWAAGIQWIDRDTDVVKTKREQWNLIVISGAAVGYFVLFVPPWHGVLFFVGLAFWLVFAGGSMLAYVVHRNTRVVPDRRVLTGGHMKRMLQKAPDKKKAVRHKGLRVQLANHQGEAVGLPGEPEEVEAYDAVQGFLYELMWRRASDVDLKPGKEQYRLVYRIDGVPAERPDGVPTEEGQRIIGFLKRIGGLNVEEIRRPQTGTIQVALLAHEGHILPTQVQTSGTNAGERLRLQFPGGATVLRIQQLGLAPPRLAELMKGILSKPTGIFLMTAPPQHGLTTTQYAVLRSHDAYLNNIHALERRSLLDLDNITQHVYEGSNTDVNYARMLQSVLRREPDIVMVGECEDRETALIATRVGAEDRKIYLGMHAKDSFDALSKYLQFLGDNRLAAKALLGVLNQRLVRLLCEDCREAYEPDPATLKKLNLPADKIDEFYRPPSESKVDRKGKPILCPNCQGTGYSGRTGVFELMIVDETVRKLIEEDTPINRIKAQCRKNKMYYLQEEALLKVIEKKTSMNEVLRCLRAEDK